MQQEKREYVLVKRTENVAVVTLNRPDKLNALSPELIKELIETLGGIINDDRIRAMVITGAGRAFCAGGDITMDIAPLSKMTPIEFEKYMEQSPVLYKLLINAKKPVIAAINGHAIGAGLDLAVACDFRIAAEDAQLGLVFVKMGIAPDVSLYLLPQIIGLSRTKRLAFTGDILKAGEAEQIGLVDQVVPSNELMASAEALAKTLAEGPVSIGIMKQIINQALRMDLDAFMDYKLQRQYQLFHTDDHMEAVRAWCEKRKPIFNWK